MYMLFEISDKVMMLIGGAFVLLIVGFIFIMMLLNKKTKVKPIADTERFEEEKVEFNDKTELTEEQLKARAELERVFNQISADVNKEAESVVDSFEREQEENAIISYQELIKQVKEKNPEKLIETEEKDEILSSLELPMEKSSGESYLSALEERKPTIEAVNINENNQERKLYSGTKTKFSSSEIISPIFGRQSVPEEDFAIEETYDTLTHEEEEKNNTEFLQSLKEFRGNL